MIQNNGKKITKKDLEYIWCAATLPYFGGGILQYQANPSKRIYKRGIVTDYSLIYVEGLNNGQAKIIWNVINGWLKEPGNVDIQIYTSGNVRRHYSNLPINTSVPASRIDPNLSIKSGEYKIILKTSLTSSSTFFVSENKTAISDVSLQEIYGFLIYSPKSVIGTAYFIETIIFTPKPELFYKTPPQ
ncbi:MAG: hypothetical protein LBO73_03550 [Holosporaceae bacterium]|jgi:hypothetical protein|nr:hypothetical protein [Holosporaceae bacterium]